MSVRELERLRTLESVAAKRITQQKAAGFLGLSTRQVRRLQQRFATKGPGGLISVRRGRPSNNRLPLGLRDQVLSLVREHYSDFGSKFAAEKLREVHGLCVSVETLRQWRIAVGQWRPKKSRELKVHPMRERRFSEGEMIQIDGSPHAWFEDRGPSCTLLVFIDDATSKLKYLRFVPSETTVAYAEGLRWYISQYGRPVSVYSDRHSIFKVNMPEAVDSLGITQFGRMAETLAIEHIHALSPQAKGRVERANQTLQDRLVKELRLAGVSTMDAANEWLATHQYQDCFNRKFAVPAHLPDDAHRPVLHTTEELELVFAHQERRVLSNSASCQYKKTIYQVKKPSLRHRGSPVIICEEANGTITMLYQSKALPYLCYRRGAARPTPVGSKEINLRVNEAIITQRSNPRWKPPVDHPWRQTITKTRHTVRKEQANATTKKHSKPPCAPSFALRAHSGAQLPKADISTLHEYRTF